MAVFSVYRCLAPMEKYLAGYKPEHFFFGIQVRFEYLIRAKTACGYVTEGGKDVLVWLQAKALFSTRLAAACDESLTLAAPQHRDQRR